MGDNDITSHDQSKAGSSPALYTKQEVCELIDQVWHDDKIFFKSLNDELFERCEGLIQRQHEEHAQRMHEKEEELERLLREKDEKFAKAKRDEEVKIKKMKFTVEQLFDRHGLPIPDNVLDYPPERSVSSKEEYLSSAEEGDDSEPNFFLEGDDSTSAGDGGDVPSPKGDD